MASRNHNIKKVEFCKNCGSTYFNNYCSDCGQKIYTKRFTFRNFFHVFLNAFDLEKGFLFTLRMLFIKPGMVINDYIQGKTKSYINPLKYLLIIAGIFAFLIVTTDIIDASIESTNDVIYSNKTLKQQQELQNTPETLQFQVRFLEAFKKYINLIPLLIIPFTSLVSMWFYRSKRLFYGEFVIANCFIFAQTFVITIVFLIPLVLIVPSLSHYFPLLSLITTLTYFIYAFYKTFSSSLVIAFIKAVLVYSMGALLFYLFLIVVFILFLIVLTIFGISLTDLLQ